MSAKERIGELLIMTDILAFIAGAASSALFFVVGAFFGAAYHKATHEIIETPDGIITFDLAQLAKLQGVKVEIKDESEDEIK